MCQAQTGERLLGVQRAERNSEKIASMWSNLPEVGREGRSPTRDPTGSLHIHLPLRLCVALHQFQSHREKVLRSSLETITE